MSLLTNVLKLWRTGQYLLPADSGFSPKHLLAGRVGWWLDPLDFRYGVLLDSLLELRQKWLERFEG